MKEQTRMKYGDDTLMKCAAKAPGLIPECFNKGLFMSAIFHSSKYFNRKGVVT